MLLQPKDAVDSLKYIGELTPLAACLGDCLSGLEALGRGGVLSSYSLLLDEIEKERGRKTSVRG